MRKCKSKMAKFFIVLLSFGVLFSSGSMLWANPIAEDLEAKIVEFEKRLEELEKRNKELQADAAESSSTAQSEELQRQLDILAAELEKMRSAEQVVEITQEDAAKQGFSSPDASWFKGQSMDFVKRMLFDESKELYCMLDPVAVQSLVAEHMSGEKNRRLLIWSLLNVQVWLEANITSSFTKNG